MEVKCRCSKDFCECIITREDTDYFPHCYQCPESEKLIGGGLECYGVYESHEGYKDYLYEN